MVEVGAAGSVAALLSGGNVQVVFVVAGAKQRGVLEALCDVRFERVSPVRSFGSFQGQRSFLGFVVVRDHG